MSKKTLLLVAAVATLNLPAAAQTVDEIVAKNIRARGGMDKIKAIQTTRMTGRVAFGPGMEAPFVRESKRPDKFRIDGTIQGTTATFQAYDGKTGWQLVPFTGNKNAEPLGGDELREAQEEADFDGPLVDHKEKGNTVELAGKEDVEGAPTYKLKVTLKNGDVIYFYVDADSFLEIKLTSRRTINGNLREIESSLGEFKPVQGVMFPYTIESAAKGSEQKQRVIVEKIDVNVPLDDSRFTMPPPAAAAPAAETKPPEAKPPVVR